MSIYTGSGIAAQPDDIASGPDGALWFSNGTSIGRITTSGVVTDYTGTHIDGPTGITAGPDGALWFTNAANNSIGRITAMPKLTLSPSSGGRRAAVRVTGEGYQPGEEVSVTYQTGLTSPASVSLCATTAASDGTFACSGDIPSGADAGAVGGHKIEAAGSSSLAEATKTFTLT